MSLKEDNIIDTQELWGYNGRKEGRIDFNPVSQN